MSATHHVIMNKDLFTEICSYLDDNELHKFILHFRRLVHYAYLLPRYHTLLYGEVQSGKTDKIMRYIKLYAMTSVKILIVQNNVNMLTQYAQALKSNETKFKIINSKSMNMPYNNENVLIVICNKFRINALTNYINNYNIHNYSLILDESDQYIGRIKKESIYLKAKHILHVTATLFAYKCNADFEFQNIVKIKPKENYIGINDIDMITVGNPLTSNVYNIGINNYKIIETNKIVDEFVKAKEGMMLINWANKIDMMRRLAYILSKNNPDVPVIIFSTEIRAYKNSEHKKIHIKNMQHVISLYDTNPHLIIIANRYSNRGFNYANKTYTRFLTHQVSFENANLKSFIQKCRILGNRPADYVGQKPKLYCIAWKMFNNNMDNYNKYIETVKNTVTNMLSIIKNKQTAAYNMLLKPDLIKLCKTRNIKGYSTKRKAEIIEMLTQADMEENP